MNTDTMRTPYPAVILAGGQGQRMGHVDKGLMVLGDKPLLAHVIARVAPQCTALAISANGDVARYGRFDLPVLPDPVLGQLGPLVGVLAAMIWAEEQGERAVYTLPNDTPFLPRDLLAHLAGDPRHPTMAQTPDHMHPTCALWPVALREPLEEALNKGVRKLRAFAADHGGATVQFSDEAAFFNVNTPQDMAQAEAMLRA
ncbi:MAG: molybdopterin-guanine dinucleotide biosynthesis protein A [Halocynthiibacter sp.]|jgi:molybdopterin-guanine dinucleotide biosynthesis protein A